MRRSRLLGLATALLLVGATAVYLLGYRRAVDEAQFLATARAEGWVPIGQFGRHWPARPVAEQQGYETLAFQLADGTRHEYVGFPGYRLRAVFLQAARNQETVVVLRSAGTGRRSESIEPKVER